MRRLRQMRRELPGKGFEMQLDYEERLRQLLIAN
jgi:hypothetical protein